jgi:hypothetical protein
MDVKLDPQLQQIEAALQPYPSYKRYKLDELFILFEKSLPGFEKSALTKRSSGFTI